MPYLHLCIGQRLAVGTIHRAMHDERLPIHIRAIVQTGKTMRYRRTGHVQQPLNRARSFRMDTHGSICSVHAHVQIMVKTQTCRQQARLAAQAKLIEVGHTGPKLVGCDLQLFDHLE